MRTFVTAVRRELAVSSLSGEFSLSTNLAISRYVLQEFGSFFLLESHTSLCWTS